MKIHLPKVTVDKVNGLNLVHIHSQIPLAGLTIVTKTGSHIESENNYGWVHFLEHCLFQGTAARKSQDIQNISHNMGGYFNAFTGHHEMCLEMEVPYYEVESGIELLLDCFFRSKFTKKNIDKERKVIYEEINMSSNSILESAKEQLFDAIVGEGTELSRSILGTKDSISIITPDSLQEFYNNIMHLDNIYFIYVGPDDKDVISKYLEKYSVYFKYIKQNGDEFRFKDLKLNPDIDEIKVEIERLNTPIASIFLQIPGYLSTDINLETAVDCIINPINSILFNHLRESKGLIYSLDTTSYMNPSNGIMEISTSSSNPQKVINSAIEILKTAHKNGINEDQIRMSKNQMKANFLRGLQTTDSIRSLVLSDIILGEITDFDEKYEDINNISSNLVNSHFTSSFDLEKIVPVTFTPAVSKRRIIKELDKLK